MGGAEVAGTGPPVPSQSELLGSAARWLLGTLASREGVAAAETPIPGGHRARALSSCRDSAETTIPSDHWAPALISVGGEVDLSGALVVSVLTATNTRRSAPFAYPETPEKMPKAKSAASGRRRERLEQRRELKRAGGAAWWKLGADRVCRCGLSRGGVGSLWPALPAAPRRVQAQRQPFPSPGLPC